MPSSITGATFCGAGAGRTFIGGAAAGGKVVETTSGFCSERVMTASRDPLERCGATRWIRAKAMTPSSSAWNANDPTRGLPQSR
jgi:hypothetical protein